jgi:hypothetical protein
MERSWRLECLQPTQQWLSSLGKQNIRLTDCMGRFCEPEHIYLTPINDRDAMVFYLAKVQATDSLSMFLEENNIPPIKWDIFEGPELQSTQKCERCST